MFLFSVHGLGGIRVSLLTSAKSMVFDMLKRIQGLGCFSSISRLMQSF